MELKEFAEKVCGEVQKELGDGCEVRLEEVRRNNGVKLQGLQFKTAGQNVAPLVHLDFFWEEYRSGVPFQEIVRKVFSACRENVPEGLSDMEFFRHFDRVRERICFRLIGKAGNREFLEGLPHVGFLDLAVCFYYPYHGEAGEGIIQLHNSHAEMWGTAADELMGLALRNTPRIMPYEYMHMEDAMREAGVDIPVGEFHEPEMYVLSNKRKNWGAACMLYPGALGEVSGGRNLFIIPSSVHEIIVVPDDGQTGAENLKQMIFEVNREKVAPEEVLSDSLYYYDAAAEEVRLA